MRIATGIAGLFLSIIIALHSITILWNGLMYQDTDSYIAGAAGLILALLFLFGGSFAFKLPITSEKLFSMAFVIALIVSIFYNLLMFIWVAIALIMVLLSKKAKSESPQEEETTTYH